MKKRTQQEWHSLFKQQIASKLSITAFCKKHGMSPSTFYKHKKALTTQTKIHSPTPFIKASLPTQRTSSAIKIQHQQTQLQLPCTMSALWLAEFVKALT